jgi:hypothetical protein
MAPNDLDIKFNNTYKLQHLRNGLVIAEQEFENALTTVGKNHILDSTFGGASQVATWYFGLINNSPTPTLLATDTLASHASWVEFSGYTGNRKEWNDAAAASGSKGNTAYSQFDINATGALYGAFLCSVASGTSGILMSQAASNSGITNVVNGDIIRINFTTAIA